MVKSSRDEEEAKVEEAPKTDASAKKTVEHWSAAKKIPKWAFNGARALRQWPVNAEVTEEDFDKAIKSTMHDRIG